jgi:hypothetical protein
MRFVTEGLRGMLAEKSAHFLGGGGDDQVAGVTVCSSVLQHDAGQLRGFLQRIVVQDPVSQIVAIQFRLPDLVQRDGADG